MLMTICATDCILPFPLPLSPPRPSTSPVKEPMVNFMAQETFGTANKQTLGMMSSLVSEY